MEKPNNQQIPIINSLRGIAALSVVFYHFICKTVDYIESEYMLDIFHYGQKGVQLFFIISGIVIPLSMINSNYKLKNFGKFITKRFVRIEPPYLVAVAIGIFYLYIRNLIPGTVDVDISPGIVEILLHIGYLVPFFESADWINPVFWTLAVEFQYYLALALFIPLAISGKIIYRITFYLIFLAAIFLPVSMAFVPFWAAYFMVGIVYAFYIKNLIGKYELSILYCLLSVLIYWHHGIVDLGIAAGAIGLIHFLPNFKSGLTLFLGKISYSLYLLHSIIGAAFVNYLSHSFTSNLGKFLVISGGIIISVGSAYLMYRIIEKPSQNLSKKIK